ncbi:outer membrane lipoprotein carrier protein LolA [Paenimyroides tangerinum]|uniref:Outer membrane lipoprotein carrier protein LolA n=1 Tax=Paenimyroides tangerinum TaxID=2488728 RepID=A0A3P3VZ89_9FLAO|nr:outer membrane lipoprotein carrier protein LolA [Paenimyroides tangerinum]RRJ88122.1 outer membrane lipoprotein carrier protein LolA [Paenimyroides tangerinum]
MKKIVALIVVCFISITNSQAQNADKAKALLNEVTTKVKSYKNIAIDFDVNINGQNSKGNITLSGDKYILNYMGITRLFDGSKVYTINPEDEEVTIQNPKKTGDESLTPSKLLTFFNSGYSFSWDISQNINGRTIQYIKLKPTGKSDVKEILLGIDSKTKHIYNKIDVYKNGSKSTLTVKSFKTNQTLSKNHFTFTESKYPKYYINKID